MVSILILAFIAALMLTLIYLVNGLVLACLWSWFMVPLGLPDIGLAWAIGIGIVGSFITRRSTVYKDHDVDSGKTLAELFISPLATLLVGWVVHNFTVGTW